MNAVARAVYGITHVIWQHKNGSNSLIRFDFLSLDGKIFHPTGEDHIKVLFSDSTVTVCVCRVALRRRWTLGSHVVLSATYTDIKTNNETETNSIYITMASLVRVNKNILRRLSPLYSTYSVNGRLDQKRSRRIINWWPQLAEKFP